MQIDVDNVSFKRTDPCTAHRADPVHSRDSSLMVFQAVVVFSYKEKSPFTISTGKAETMFS